MSWLSPEDRQLATLLAGGRETVSSLSALFERAERHGVGGVVVDRVETLGNPIEPSLRARLEQTRVARELDHVAHLATLKRLDATLADAGLRAVVLKGPLFAERFYARPCARATSDIDLLVAEEDLDRAAAVLEKASYVVTDDAKEQAWALAEHHHLHLTRERSLPLELHFHAYRGLGSILRAKPLIDRSRALDDSWRALRVLAAPDELVFLSVHAAAHRFVRLGWLYDLKLLLESMSAPEREEAARRAAETSFDAPVALAIDLLRDAFHVDPSRARELPLLTPLRRQLLRAVTSEPRHPLLRSATRFVYTVSLCPDPGAALEYGARSSRYHVRRGLARLRG